MYVWSNDIVLTNKEQIDHTADMGLRVEADQLESIFPGMAQAIAQISYDIELVRELDDRIFTVEAPDIDALLIRFINEVLHYIAIGFLGKKFAVELISDTKAKGAIIGEKFRIDRHKLHHEIKRATYHALKLFPHESGWIAEVIFDM